MLNKINDFVNTELIKFNENDSDSIDIDFRILSLNCHDFDFNETLLKDICFNIEKETKYKCYYRQFVSFTWLHSIHIYRRNYPEKSYEIRDNKIVEFEIKSKYLTGFSSREKAEEHLNFMKQFYK